MSDLAHAPRTFVRRLIGRAPVSRADYAYVGFGLAVLKYATEVVAVLVITGQFFSPWMFVVPSLEGRRELFGEENAFYSILWAVWTLPFVAIAFAMTVRRAVDSGRSPWWSVLIFVPLLNVGTMLAFATLADVPRDPDPGYEDDEVPPPNLIRFFAGFALSLTVAGGMFSVAVYGAGEYGAALFFGTPLVMGMTIAVFTHRPGAPRGAHLGNSVLAAVVFSGALIMLGFEGVICVVMMLPIAIPLSLIGAVLGRAICERSTYPRRQAGLAVLGLPLWLLTETAVTTAEPVYAVTTSVEIDAPIATVWQNVVGFPALEPPDEWVFRVGIACPIRARIEGQGVGAVRHCEFTTGTFVEPITVWDAPHHLAFDVTEQPAPMFELSPYAGLHPPHLDGALRSVRGEFRLEALPSGGTWLTGTTWYQLDMHPRHYWILWSDWLIQTIHRRVLNHIKKNSE